MNFHMNKPVFILLMGLIPAISVKAQGNTEEVKETVQRLFEAMRNADGSALTALFTDSAILHTTVSTPEGKTSVKAATVQQFAQSVSKSKKGALDERIQFGGVNVDGSLASVWTPYRFYYDGQFSHCGANSFQLIYTEGRWKIHFLIDTRRKTGCD